ncbi:MAG: lamin tail domain-containing protein [Flavobacteriales bacterium]
MKGIALVAALCIAWFGSAWSQCQDDFTDGDFSNNPTWTGSTSNYIVNAGIVELNAPSGAAGQSALAFACDAVPLQNREWRIWVDQNLAGSATNQTRIYFASNGPALNYSGSGSAGVEGYFLLLGETLGDDVIRLYSDNGIDTTLIASGQTSIAAAFQARIKITVDNQHSWTVSADFTGGENYVDEFSIVENGLSSATHFSIINTYTSSNVDFFSFDDIYSGPIQVDTSPPGVVAVTATSLNTIDVLFNEAVSATSATDATHYTIVNSGNALSASIDANNAALVHLTTPSFNANTTYTLGIQQIADIAGNTMSMPSLVEFSFFEPVSAQYRDVIFNEVLADPTPSAGLPGAEFVELYNQHPTNAFNFQGWKFVNSSTEKILPSFTIAPGAHVILCDMTNVSIYQPFGEVVGITSFTALTNTGDSLTLKDNNNQVIDILVYSDDWFETDAKRDGGWSLELVNPNLPCANAANWRESIAANGGTPGAVNSQFNTAPDITAPSVVSIEVLDTQTILVTFSEPMDTSGWSSPSWEVLPFNSAVNGVWSAQLNAVTLDMASPIIPSNIYQLQMSGISELQRECNTLYKYRFCFRYFASTGRSYHQ